MGIFQVLDDHGRIVEGQVPVDEDRDLSLGIDGQHVRVPGAVALRLRERHQDLLEGEPLLVKGNLDLAGEEAHRTGIELHRGAFREIIG
jgi:hypothetical protein